MPDDALVREVVAKVVAELGVSLSDVERAVSDLTVLEAGDKFVKCNHDGKASTWHYQQGCRGTLCRQANSDYYRRWRAEKKRKKQEATQAPEPPKRVRKKVKR